MSVEPFELMLTGGHPNSLGRTVDVTACVLADQTELEQLYQCYFSADEVVRLRTSSVMKRIWRQHPEWLTPYLDRFLSEISQIEQASTRWTLAQLFLELEAQLTAQQRRRAEAILRHNLVASNDWMVIINTLQVLGAWATQDDELRHWLMPHVLRFTADNRKSVARAAHKLRDALG